MTPEPLVVDTNLIFSALLAKESELREKILSDDFILFAPNFLITEIYRHKSKLLKSSKLTEEDLYIYLNGVLERIRFIPIEMITIESRKAAYELCHDIDPSDTPFIALSIALDIPLWTGDKKLKNKLKKKGFSNFH